MSSSDPTLETPWNSPAEADTAVNTYYGEGGGGGGEEAEEGGGGGDSTVTDTFGESATLSGSLNAPRELVRGDAVTMGGSITNSGSAAEQGQFVLALTDGSGGAYRLDSVSTSIAVGERIDVEYVVPQGAVQNAPGKATLAIVAFVSQGSGTVTSEDVRIVEPGEEQTPEEQMGGWSEPYFVQELPYGWNLYGQDHEEKGTRYLISAKDSSGGVIYLTRNGSLSQRPVYFSDVDNIVSAINSYGAEYEAGGFEEGTTPDPAQPRPTAEELTADIIGAEAGGLGFLDRLTNGHGLEAAMVILLAGVYFARSRRTLTAKQTRRAALLAGGVYAWLKVQGGR